MKKLLAGVVLLLGMALGGTAWAVDWHEGYGNDVTVKVRTVPVSRRLVDKPIVTETKDGRIQVEYLHGVNDHVEIMSKETAKDLAGTLAAHLDGVVYWRFKGFDDDAKPAAR